MNPVSVSDLEPVFYLITTDATGDRQRHQLHPRQVTSIGRASTNKIVLTDEICSRNHCEVFLTSDGWKLRDRSSRNGTYVNQEKIQQDHPLHHGDVIRIGSTFLLFSRDADAELKRSSHVSDRDTATDLLVMQELPLGTEILYRQKKSTFRDAQIEEQKRNPQTSSRISRLCQLASRMGTVQSAQELADVVLNGLVGITGADIGAVLTRQDYTAIAAETRNFRTELVTTSYRSLSGQQYRRVSQSLTEQVCLSREAILARDINSDLPSQYSRDSLDDLQAESVIVAPVTEGAELYGLIHLYSTNPENPLDVDELDYTLAVADQLAVSLQNLHQRQQLQESLRRIKQDSPQQRPALSIESELIGQSAAMQNLRDMIALVAPTDTVVLIRGESGVGKELVARAIHFNSKRKQAPIVCMNCAALSESLLESELFGHEKGSFTGATGMKAGKFEQANKGTLFLDEVGEMSPAIQAKFLRVLEGHPFERVGGSVSIHVDVRLVAATNRNLEEAVRDMTFRKDLYFRLQVLEIHVPPLRERATDIPLLAQFFADRLTRKTSRPALTFSPEALEKMLHYRWPGNVRELQNTVERAVVLCPTEQISAALIQLTSLESEERVQPSPGDQDYEYNELSIEDLEKDHILKTLELTQGNKSKASQILGIERSTLDRKLKKYGIKNFRNS